MDRARAEAPPSPTAERRRSPTALDAVLGGLASLAPPAAGILLGAVANRILPTIVGVVVGLLLPALRRPRVTDAFTRLGGGGRALAPSRLARVAGGVGVLAVVGTSAVAAEALDLGAEALLGLGGAAVMVATAAAGALLVVSGLLRARRPAARGAGETPEAAP